MPSTVIFGSGIEFASDGTVNYVVSAPLSSGQFVVAYTDTADANHGTAKIGNVSGTNITYGAESEFRNNGSTNVGSVASISSSGFVVVYKDVIDSSHGIARIGSVSGDTITSYGARAKYLAASATYNSASVLSSGNFGKFVVGYSDGGDSDHGKVRIGSISGTTITYGTEATFYSAETVSNVSVAALSESQFVVAYVDDVTNHYGRAKIGTVSGTTVTFGDEAIFLAADSAEQVVVTAISDNKFIVGYQDVSDNRHGTVKIGTVDGTIITFGAESEFLDVNGAYFIDIGIINSSQLVVVYKDVFDSDHGTAKIGTVDGTTVAFGLESEFLSNGAANYNRISIMSDSKMVVTYGNAAVSNHGTANVGDFPTISSLTGSGNLYIQGIVEYVLPSGSTPDLFINGFGQLTDSCDLVVGGQNDIQISGNLFIEGMPSNSIDLFIHGLQDDTVPGNLYIEGHVDVTGSGNLFIMGPLPETASGNLFIHGYDNSSGSMTLFTYSPPPDIYGSILLYLKVPEPSNASGNLYLHGPEQTLASGNLFIVGPLLVSTSGNFFMHGPELASTSGNLFMRGAIESLAESIDWLLRTHDHYPQILGTFESATSVNIQLWDITDGQNTLVSVTSSGCYQIGDTGRWGWSTANIPITQGNGKQYFYLMTSNASITFGGQFFLELPEGAKWIHPSDPTDYLKQI